MSTTVADLLLEKRTQLKVEIKGWVRTFRANRFIALNDGSTINNIQCVVDFENFNEALLKRVTTGAALYITGELVESQGKGQSVEVVVSSLEILGDSDPESYPIQPKKHSFEFLRDNAHLRTRTSTLSAVMRVKSSLSFAIHKYFTENGFYNMHTPIITGSDAEGAGEMFRITTLDFKNPPLDKSGEVNFKEDFFGKEANLTVSGQLEAETYAMSLGKVYTFGPTFRAENSNTSRHLSEFWMVEPEVAFMDLAGNMDLAEDFMKSVIQYILNHNKEDLLFLDERLFNEEKSKPQTERSPMRLIEKLKFVTDNNFKRVSYTEAIDILNDLGLKGLEIIRGLTLEELNLFFALSVYCLKSDKKIENAHDLKKLHHLRIITLQEENEKPRAVYNAAMQAVDQVFNDIKGGRVPSTEGLRNVSKSMVQSVLREKHALFALAQIKDYDNYTFNHSVNVGIISLTVGHACNIDPKQLALLAFGGMVHELCDGCPPLRDWLARGAFFPVPNDGAPASIAASRSSSLA